MAQERRLPSFVGEVISTIKADDFESFCNLVGDKEPKWTSQELQSLMNYTDSDGENIYHYLLRRSKYSIFQKKRRNHLEMFHQLLKLSNDTSLLNKPNRAHLTPFHLAIKQGDTNIVEMGLEEGVNISYAKSQPSYLEFAAKCNNTPAYKLLLKKHTELNKKAQQPKGFSVSQLSNALATHNANMKRKQFFSGVFGAIMSIACPVGAMLTFYELPLLELFFGALIPGIGPFIGLALAITIGGMLFWSMYHKSSMKNGAYAQEMARLDSVSAQINRLEAEQRHIEQQLSKETNPVKSEELRQNKQNTMTKLADIYNTIKPVERRNAAPNKNWATKQDKLRTYTLSFGAFVCAFSGILGIMGFFAPYLPAAAFASAAFAGVPIVGWAALGVGLLIGVGVAVWAYNAKFKGGLEQAGKARKDLHVKQLGLYNKRIKFEDTKSQTLSVGPSQHNPQEAKSQQRSEKIEPKYVAREDKDSKNPVVSATREHTLGYLLSKHGVLKPKTVNQASSVLEEEEQNLEKEEDNKSYEPSFV